MNWFTHVPNRVLHLNISTWIFFYLRKCYGTYLHGNGLFLLNIYRLYSKLAEITSKLSGAYALLSGWRWGGTHFGRPRFIGARIWSDVSWFQWQPWPATSSFWGPFPQALTLLRGARFITWCLRRPFLGECRRGPRFLGNAGRVCATALRPDPSKKRPCATLVRMVGRKTNTDILQAEWSVCTSLLEALGWDTLLSAAFYRCADLVGCVLVPVAVGRGTPWLASSSLRGPSH